MIEWMQNLLRQDAWGLNPQRLFATLPPTVENLVVNTGGLRPQRLYWQIQQGQAKHLLTLSPLAIEDRAASLTLDAEAVGGLLAEDAHAYYLLSVPVRLLGSFLQSRVAINAVGRRCYLLLPAEVMYDFVAGSSDLTVADLLDGWPMREARSLSSMLALPQMTTAAHATTRSVTWQQAGASVQQALADLHQVAQQATFVITTV